MGPKGNAKAASKSRATEVSKSRSRLPNQNENTELSIDFQQTILDIFKQALRNICATDFKPLIQEVKGHLYNRNFEDAFGKQNYLEAYALRWSASRALGYSQILRELKIWPPDHASCPAGAIEVQKGASKAVCIGGGAGAELVALVAAGQPFSTITQEITLIDTADWSKVVSDFEKSLTSPAQRPLHATHDIQASNQVLIDADHLHVEFLRKDVLTWKEEFQQILSNAYLCTIMFTLNELFTTSISQTTAFLLNLTDAMPSGSWLLVVDSPGSYSEIQLGSSSKSKRYPMNWLLDHTLLEVTRNDKADAKWEKHASEESKWFRLDPRLNYPIDLENMRYQLHSYQRLSNY